MRGYHSVWGQHRNNEGGYFLLATGLTFGQADDLSGNLEAEFPGTRFWTERD